MHHTLTLPCSRITDFTFLGDTKLATYSALDNHLLVTDLVSGLTEHSSTAQLFENSTIEGLTCRRDGSLNVLVVGKESLEYSLVTLRGDTIISGLKAKSDELSHRYVLSDSRLVRITTTGEEQSVSSIEIADLV